MNIVLRVGEGDDHAVAGRLARIFEAIIREREFQTEKYGPVLIPHDRANDAIPIKGFVNPAINVQGPGGHELGAWLVILESELDEAKKALVHGGSKSVKGRDTIRAEIVQIAAVAIAALEQHGVEE